METVALDCGLGSAPRSDNRWEFAVAQFVETKKLENFPVFRSGCLLQVAADWQPSGNESLGRRETGLEQSTTKANKASRRMGMKRDSYYHDSKASGTVSKMSTLR